MKIAAWLFLLLIANTPVKPDQAKTNAKYDSDSEGGRNRQVIVIHNETTAEKPTDNSAKAAEGDSSVNWSNWALVAIGAITALAVWIQARETANATKAMRDSIPHQKAAAEASKKSADALINAERAWIMVDLQWTSSNGRLVRISSPYASTTNGVVQMTCKNRGNTPAWIEFKCLKVMVTDHVPEEPDITGLIARGDLFLFPEMMYRTMSPPSNSMPKGGPRREETDSRWSMESSNIGTSLALAI